MHLVHRLYERNRIGHIRTRIPRLRKEATVDVDKPGGYSPTRAETRPVPHSFITGGAAMKRTAPLAVSALIVGTLIGSVGTQALHAQQQGLKRTPLMQKDLAGSRAKKP